MKREEADRVRQETRETYEKSALEFSGTRARFWDELAFLADHIERDDHVLDLGCGNARFYPLVRERHASYMGIDLSEGLIEEARRHFPDASVTVGDGTRLPFGGDTFDIVFSFAVLHHLPTKEERAALLTEAARVLHPGGKLILTVWDLWNMRHMGDILRSAFRDKKRGEDFTLGDVMLEFGQAKRPRYVRALRQRELRDMLHEAGFAVSEIVRIPRESGEANIVAIAERPLLLRESS